MNQRTIAVASVLAVALGIVVYKQWPRAGIETASSPSATQKPRVVFVADLSEAEDACGCGEIIRAVRAARASGISVLELDPEKSPAVASQYQARVSPTVLFLDAEGNEAKRFEGEGRWEIDNRGAESGARPSQHGKSMTSVLDLFSSVLASSSALALPLAFLAGGVMGLNPCCLALYPAAAATCSADHCDDTTRPVFGKALFFVLGTAVATMLLGVVAALLGKTLGGVGGWIHYLFAFVPLLMGMHVLGWIRLPMPKIIGANRRGHAGAFVSGLTLSLVIGPCGTPALAAILAYAALQSVAFAAVLLFAYGLGNGLPVLVVGAASSHIAQRLAKFGRGRWVENASGVMLLGLGFFLLLR